MLESLSYPPRNRRMNQALDIVRNDILAAGELSERDLESTLGRLLEHSVDEADLYFQSTRFEAWVLEDGIVKQGSHNIEQGVGVRAVSGEKSGFAYSDELAHRGRWGTRRRPRGASPGRAETPASRHGGAGRRRRSTPPSIRSSRSTNARASPCWNAPMRRPGGSARTSSRSSSASRASTTGFSSHRATAPSPATSARWCG